MTFSFPFINAYDLIHKFSFKTYLITCIEPLLEAEARLWWVIQGAIEVITPPCLLYVAFDLLKSKSSFLAAKFHSFDELTKKQVVIISVTNQANKCKKSTTHTY